MVLRVTREADLTTSWIATAGYAIGSVCLLVSKVESDVADMLCYERGIDQMCLLFLPLVESVPLVLQSFNLLIRSVAGGIEGTPADIVFLG
jgi:hypothetical protein